MDSKREDLEMDLKSRLTMLSILENGQIMKRMVKASSFMWMVMCIKETGPMIKPMELAFSAMLMAHCIKAMARMTYSMVRLLRL